MEYNQESFIGGMNLLLDDTRLANFSRWSYNQALSNNQYRLLLNGRNRYDEIDSIASSVLDISLPAGVIQEITTFGNFVIAFVSGSCHYRLYNGLFWNQVDAFSMSASAPRYWTVSVPLATTNYGRASILQANTVLVSGATNVAPANTGILQIQSLAASFSGNVPGLLVQDGINQPTFIYIDNYGNVQARVTQNYIQWNAVYGLTPSNYGVLLTDNREYVPIGTTMAYTSDGKLFIASTDGVSILQSVSGRPLDFVINVNVDGSKGGDAYTTSYSVGVGPIACLRPISTGGLFVAAANSNFTVTLNKTPGAPTQFGEYTFIRTFLFESTCLSDRCIMDSLGDTRFIDLTGVRSFNAIEQSLNEGRNSVFTSTIAKAFQGIVQDVAAAIFYDNYEYYGVNTIFGPAIAIYDTINNDWVGFDVLQTGGKKIKAFAKIELAIQALFAITEDDQLYQLYASTTNDDLPTIRLAGLCTMDPRKEQSVINTRVILTNITQDYSVTASLFVNNRFVISRQQILKYVPAPNPYTGISLGPDIGTQTNNILFTFPNSQQGWKAFIVLSWTGGGSLVSTSVSTEDLMPMQPPTTQSVVNQS